MKQKLPYIVLMIIMFMIVAIPSYSSDLIIRLHVDETDFSVDKNGFALYYSTKESGGFQADQIVDASIDEGNHMLEFRLDAALREQIDGLRLDFPTTDQVVAFNSLSISSGGFVKEQLKPAECLRSENMQAMNEISAINIVKETGMSFVATQAEDPYLVFSDNLTEYFLSKYSSMRGTKILFCILVCLGVWSYKKNLFQSEVK